jgi:hypothetical protein
MLHPKKKTHLVPDDSILHSLQPIPHCCNLNLGFTTKVRACKSAGQKWSLKFTFHAPESIGKCEKMNPHTPEWAPTLGVGVSMNF